MDPPALYIGSILLLTLSKLAQDVAALQTLEKKNSGLDFACLAWSPE